MEKILYKITVKGRVQGVGFRHSASTVARYNGVKGFVKNCDDGTVYIEAEGNRNQLDEFVNWCRKGPGLGNVEDVIIETDSPKNHSKFQIKH
jgi:acylphosphatase